VAAGGEVSETAQATAEALQEYIRLVSKGLAAVL